MKKTTATLLATLALFLGCNTADVEAADYPKYDGNISQIKIPTQVRYTPIPVSKQISEIFYLVDLGPKKIKFVAKLASLVGAKKENGQLILSTEIDPDDSTLFINGEDASDKLKAQGGLKAYFEVTNKGELLKSSNNFQASSLAFIAPKLINSIVDRPNQPVASASYAMTTSKKIPTNFVWKGVALGTSSFNNRKVLVTKTTGEMNIGNVFKIPMEGYQLFDLKAGYVLETKMAGAITLRPSDVGFKGNQIINLQMRIRSTFDPDL